MEEVVPTLEDAADFFYRKNELSKAKHKFISVYERSVEDSDLNTRCKSLCYLIDCSEKLGQHGEVLKYYRELDRLSNKVNNEEVLIRVLQQLCNEAQHNGDIQTAIDFGLKALFSARRERLPNLITSSCIRLGDLYQQTGNYEQSLLFFEEALQESSKSESVSLQAQILQNIAGIYLVKEQFDSALVSSSQAFNLCKQIHNINGILLTGLRTASIYVELSDTLNARQILEGLSNLLNESENISFAITASMIYGKIEEKHSQLDAALHHYYCALDLTQKSEKLRLEINTKAHIGKVFTEQGIYDTAIETLQDAIALAEKISDHYGIESSMELLAEAYERKGDSALALEAHKKYFNLYKKSADENADRRLKALQIKYEVDKKEKEAELYRLKLEKAEHELSTNTAHLVKQTEMLARFRDELKDIVRQYPASDPGWKAVKEKLKELPCKQIDWEKFETEFAAVHPEFMKKLYERYASLTPMEVKMCSLLRLNLKSHEIARLFCVTERAVEFHRLNIRKKCGIPKEQSLSVFLNNL